MDEFERRINAQIDGYPAYSFKHTKEVLREVLQIYKETRENDVVFVHSGPTVPVKPPLGLRPKFVCSELRIEEIRAAVERYQGADVAVPRAWYDELRELTQDRWMKKPDTGPRKGQITGMWMDEVEAVVDALRKGDDTGVF